MTRLMAIWAIGENLARADADAGPRNVRCCLDYFRGEQ